ncbi:MAG: glycoside hydrolase family 3 N-terminal domain-containing protein [Terriglobia bacterium]
MKETFQSLSLEEKIGQMIVPGFRGIYSNSRSAEYLELVRLIRDQHIGGLILFAGDIYESAILINQLQALARVPLLISSDFERGASFRIRHTLSLPWNMAVGATDSEDWAYLQGKLTAQEARAMGINWVFAPVLDVNSNPANPVINIRSYGENPQMVARLGVAFIQGAQDAGVLATAKHFPGHGDTNIDSHLSLPVIRANRRRLESVDWVPFVEAIRKGVWSVMSAHVSVPALEPHPGRPATLSRRIMTEVLQKDLGFTNLIVSDSLSMAGLTENDWLGEAAVQAVNAGVDLLLDPPSPSVVYHAILTAVRTGFIDPNRIDHSVQKILRAKAWLGLSSKPRLQLKRIHRAINHPRDQEVVQKMTDASITLVRDSKAQLPLDVRQLGPLHANLVLGREPHEDTQVFETEMSRRLEQVTFSQISAKSTKEEFENALQAARKAGHIVCAVFARVVTATGTIELSDQLVNWIRSLRSLEKPLIVISFGNPYFITRLPQVSSYLCAFNHTFPSQRSAVRALFGEIKIGGKLPVSIPKIARIGTGIERQPLEMRLKHISSKSGMEPPPEIMAIRSRLRRNLDNLIHSEIENRTFPGCCVAIGYRHWLVWNQGYGRLTYAPQSPAVTPGTIFDLASLTKVVVTATLSMQLIEQRLLRPHDRLTRFFPSATGKGKEKITVTHLLAHSSGLPAHRPLYLRLQSKSVMVAKILRLPLQYETGQKSEYSDLGFILLGDIIEKLTGKSLDLLASERIFRPLGMKHTLFNPPVTLKSRIAPTEQDPWRNRLLQGEVHDENASAMGGVAPHAGLFGTTGDLAIFSQMVLNGGVYDHCRIIFPGTLKKFTSRQRHPSGTSRGLGWDTPSSESSAGTLLSPKAFGHTGFTGTSLWIDPTRELSVILLTNRVFPSRKNNAIREFRGRFADWVVKSIENRPV